MIKKSQFALALVAFVSAFSSMQLHAADAADAKAGNDAAQKARDQRCFAAAKNEAARRARITSGNDEMDCAKAVLAEQKKMTRKTKRQDDWCWIDEYYQACLKGR